MGLDRTTILSTGCELARRDGIDALGVRSVAAALGSTPMALYRYVTDAVDLRESVLALLLQSVPSPSGSLADLTAWAQAFRIWLSGVPGLPRLLLLRWFELPALLDVVESLLEMFAVTGIEGFELVAAANSLFSWLLARGEVEEAVRAGGTRRSLPWDGLEVSHPLLIANRAEYEIARLDKHFDYGLSILLQGLRDAGEEK